MMSVVVEEVKSGQIILYAKGADSAIFQKLSTQIAQPFLTKTEDDIVHFSTKGLRTLCFAMRVLDRNFYLDWAHRLEQAKFQGIVETHESEGEEGFTSGIAELHAEIEQ
mmetsp:Transcript_25517/g.19274  ORF Transcript_25517/g.19274 Transcript_25517/m.19274 type:complete len:109 (-) Transcript_25517:1835-2161(-)